MKKIVTSVLSGMAGALLIFGFLHFTNNNANLDNTKNGIGKDFSIPVKVVSDDPTNSQTKAVDFSEAASNTVNAVVHIYNKFSVENYYYDPLKEFMYGDGRFKNTQKGEATGSGVIISKDGYIVTNNHVIKDAEELTVTLNNKKKYKAEVIGSDPSTDIALIKIDASDLNNIILGNSDDVKVGEWVLAVGNPFNLTSTVTAGIVSAKARNINLLQYDPDKDEIPLESFIQTDAAVNPGNSGGALVNDRGELIGINTAIASNTGSYTGYSFAVPVNIVRKVAQDLLEFGEVKRAYIGVSIQNMDQELADKINSKSISGVYVAGLMDKSAAMSADIKKGDIILKVGDIAVNEVSQLQEQIGKFRPGDKVNITISRDGNEIVVPITLTDQEGSTEISKTTISTNTNNNKLGASFSMPSLSKLQLLGLKKGVEITSLKSGKIMSSGIKKGFIITKIDNKPVESPEQVTEYLLKKQGGVLLEGVYPDGRIGYYGFGL